jgi:hypothetical protein
VAAGLRLALLVALRLRAGHAAAFGHASAPAIVSLNPCSDAILAEVADPGQVLALSHYSRDPRSSSMDVGLARRFPPRVARWRKCWRSIPISCWAIRSSARPRARPTIASAFPSRSFPLP